MILKRLCCIAFVVDRNLLPLRRKCPCCNAKKRFNDIVTAQMKKCFTMNKRKSECKKSEIQAGSALVEPIVMVPDSPL